MTREFDKIIDIYSLPDKKGKQKLLKKGVIQKVILDTDKIQAEQYIDYRGKLHKKKCLIKCGDEIFTVNHSYEEIKTILVKPEIKIIGFNNKLKK